MHDVEAAGPGKVPDRLETQRPIRIRRRGPACVALALLMTVAGGCGTSEDTPARHEAGHDDSAGTEANVVEYAASHILITHAESVWHPPEVTRSRKEASNLARHIAVLTRQRGADFADLAREYSEDPVAQESGGYLGIFRTGEMVIPFEVAVKNMRVGQVGVVTETEFGFHIIKRHPIRRVHGHHILIAWRDAVNVSTGVRRTKEQARTLAEEVRALATADGADLCELALRFSDDPNNSSSCGDIGLVEPGLVQASFEEALFKLKPGMVSEIVESDYGYHIIWRHD